MTWWGRASESGAGRWHVRLEHPAGIVKFTDLTAGSIEDATVKAQAAFPNHTVIWAVREPMCYGVWGAPGANRR